MERWNGGIVEWLDGRLTTLHCFAAVTVINTHAHYGATVSVAAHIDDHLRVRGLCTHWRKIFLLGTERRAWRKIFPLSIKTWLA